MLILAATPIGNLGDVTARLADALSTASLIAAEDTRTTIALLRSLGIDNRPELISLHDHNETRRSAHVVARARDEDVLVLSDAGMPTVSDPGYHLVRAAIEVGVVVTALPGPSAVLTALAISGLPTDRFTFEGFIPRKSGERLTRLTSLAREERTMIFFESPHRLHDFLIDAANVFGPDRRAAVCRELTKMFEEVKRDSLGALAEWALSGVKGEVVVVIAGVEPAPVAFDAALAEVALLVESGVRLKDACAEVSANTGHSRRALYQASLSN